MRYFSEEEKSFIRLIASSDGSEGNLMNLLMPRLQREGVGLALKRSGGSMTVTLLSRPEDHQAKAKCHAIQRLIARTGNLIHDLERNGCLIAVTPAKEKIAEREYGGISDACAPLPPIPWILPDATTTGFIVDNIDKEFIPTPLLTSLIQNDFRSEEEIRFRRQQRATWVAVWSAIILGLVSVAFAGYQVHLARYGVEAQGWQQINQAASEILKLSVDHPVLRPYFCDGKPLAKSDPNYDTVMTVSEIILAYFNSLGDEYVRSLEGMKDGGKNWVLWEKWFRGYFATSPALCACYEQLRDRYPMDLTKYLPTNSSARAADQGLQSATNGIGESGLASQTRDMGPIRTDQRGVGPIGYLHDWWEGQLVGHHVLGLTMAQANKIIKILQYVVGLGGVFEFIEPQVLRYPLTASSYVFRNVILLPNTLAFSALLSVSALVWWPLLAASGWVLRHLPSSWAAKICSVQEEDPSACVRKSESESFSPTPATSGIFPPADASPTASGLQQPAGAKKQVASATRDLPSRLLDMLDSPRRRKMFAFVSFVILSAIEILTR